MNTFQKTVVGVAIVILILILTIVGISMVSNKKNMLFPPSSLSCPDYWELNNDGTCNIPLVSNPIPTVTLPAVNVGTWDNKQSTPGIDTTKSKINFNSNEWGASSQSATCAKQQWAKKYGIMWDGVSNYNGCT